MLGCSLRESAHTKGPYEIRIEQSEDRQESRRAEQHHLRRKGERGARREAQSKARCHRIVNHDRPSSKTRLEGRPATRRRSGRPEEIDGTRGGRMPQVRRGSRRKVTTKKGPTFR